MRKSEIQGDKEKHKQELGTAPLLHGLDPVGKSTPGDMSSQGSVNMTDTGASLTWA